MELNDATFRQLLDLTDPIGVLTVTAGFVPGTADDQDATRIDLHNQLRDAQSRCDEQDRTERARALEKVAGQLGDDVTNTVSRLRIGHRLNVFYSLPSEIDCSIC